MRLSHSMLLTSMLAACLAVSLAHAEDMKFKGTVLQQVDLGNLPAGERVMKLTMLELQPGAEIPPHTHKGPGLRYVVEGDHARALVAGGDELEHQVGGGGVEGDVADPVDEQQADPEQPLAAPSHLTKSARVG